MGVRLPPRAPFFLTGNESANAARFGDGDKSLRELLGLHRWPKTLPPRGAPSSELIGKAVLTSHKLAWI